MAKRQVRVGSDANVDNDVEVEDFSVGLDSSSDEESLYKALQLEVKKKARKDPVVLSVPLRPKLKLIYDPNIDFDDYNAWVRKCRKKNDDEIDYWRLSQIILSRTSIGVIFAGKRVGDLTLASSRFHDLMGVPTGGTIHAIKHVYGLEGHAIQAMNKVVKAAGYSLDGDIEEDDENPLDD